MSVNIYNHATKLPNVVGRVDYISNPRRQENLLATATTTTDPAFWARLAADSQLAFRQAGRLRKNDRCCEAREICGALPNSALEGDLSQVAEMLAADFKEQYGVECTVAIHLNASKSNLHYHLIYSERQLLPEPEIRMADRAAFFDENGVRKRTKKEILDDNGQLRPGCRIIPKGEVLFERYFTEKDPRFAGRGWLYDHKRHMADWINRELQPDELRTVFDKHGPYLAQKHVGKGVSAEKAKSIERWNGTVKIYNSMVRSGKISPEDAQINKTLILLAPDQLQELEAIMGAMVVEKQGGLTERQKEVFEANAMKAGKTPRTMDTPGEDMKRQLREAYRRSAAAWKEYRGAEGLDKEIKKAEALKISAEIRRLQKARGYEEPQTVADRKRAVWDVSYELREASDGGWWAMKAAAYQAKSDAWDAMRKADMARRDMDVWVEHRDGKKIRHYPVRRYSAQEKNEAMWAAVGARDHYWDTVARTRAFVEATKLQADYRRYALELAEDPDVTPEEAAAALAVYQEAGTQLLRNPTPEYVQRLRKDLEGLLAKRDEDLAMKEQVRMETERRQRRDRRRQRVKRLLGSKDGRKGPSERF